MDETDDEGLEDADDDLNDDAEAEAEGCCCCCPAVVASVVGGAAAVLRNQAMAEEAVVMRRYRARERAMECAKRDVPKVGRFLIAQQSRREFSSHQ